MERWSDGAMGITRVANCMLYEVSERQRPTDRGEAGAALAVALLNNATTDTGS